MKVKIIYDKLKEKVLHMRNEFLGQSNKFIHSILCGMITRM